MPWCRERAPWAEGWGGPWLCCGSGDQPHGHAAGSGVLTRGADRSDPVGVGRRRNRSWLGHSDPLLLAPGHHLTAHHRLSLSPGAAPIFAVGGGGAACLPRGAQWWPTLQPVPPCQGIFLPSLLFLPTSSFGAPCPHVRVVWPRPRGQLRLSGSQRPELGPQGAWLLPLPTFRR